MPALKKPDDHPKMTVDEFLLWGETQEGKWELHDGVPVRKHDPLKMQSERFGHVKAKAAIYLALHNAIMQKKLDCSAVTDGASVRITDEITYIPDALVFCNKHIDDDEIIIADPVIIVEVLSPSTAYKDVSTKLRDYFTLTSVMHYLIIDPKLRRIQHHYRRGNGIKLAQVEGETLALDPPGISIEVKDIFV